MSNPKTTNKDYARRPELIGDLDYVEWIKIPTFEALNRIKERAHSEFKKPYREDDHIPMEYWADYPFPVYTFPPFPNFPGPIPGPSSPWNLLPGEEEEGAVETGCPPICMCDPGNPETIIAGGSSVVLNVIACAPPNSVTISIHESNYFKVKTQPIYIEGSGAQWAFSILAEADACGICTIIVSCSDGSGTICYLRCDNGQWVHLSAYDNTCVLSGVGTASGSPPQQHYYYELISGYQKQWQDTQYKGAANYTCSEEYCFQTYCPSFNCTNYGDVLPCANCVDALHTMMPMAQCTYGGGTCSMIIYCVNELKYYEWGCPQ